MAAVSTWSTTAASNNSTPPDGWPEEQAPSTVNNCAREMMASLRTQLEGGEWFNWGSTHTYVSATSFTVATDLTDRYHVGRRIKAVGASTGTIHGVIDSSSFSSPNTTVVVRWDTGSQLVSETLTISLAIARAKSISIPYIGRKNFLENGALDVWQDSTSRTGVTAAVQSADFIAFELGTHGTWTIARDTDVPTVAQAGRKLNYSLKATVTTADATADAASRANFRYTIEGYDYQPLFQQPQTLTFWAKSDTTGTYGVSFRNAATDRAFVEVFTIATANTWEKKSIALTTAHTGTWEHTTGVGVHISICLAAGTNFQTTASAWQTGNFLTTSSQTNLAATVNNDFWIADLRLCGGYDTSDIIVPTFGEVLRLAQRRFAKTFEYVTAPAQNAGGAGSIRTMATAAGALSVPWRYPVEMRASPTITTYSPGNASNGWWDGSIAYAPSTTDLGSSGVSLVNGTTVAASAAHHIHAGADARF